MEFLLSYFRGPWAVWDFVRFEKGIKLLLLRYSAIWLVAIFTGAVYWHEDIRALPWNDLTSGDISYVAYMLLFTLVGICFSYFF